LLGMEVHGENAGDAGGGEEIGHEFGRDGNAGLVLAVLAGIAKKGNNRGDPGGAGWLAGKLAG
jgi:hypothetical protein